MTVPTVTTRNRYTGNSVTTVFAYTFGVDAATEIQVSLIEGGVQTIKTLNVDYTVSGVGEETGGNVTFLSAPTGAQDVLLAMNVPNTQPTDYKNQGSFYPRTHERSFDRLTRQVQQVNTLVGRSFVLPDSVDDVDTELPVPEANAIIGWNAGGDGLRNFAAGEVASVAAYADWQVDVFTGDGVTEEFTLTNPPPNAKALMVDVDGIMQLFGVDYAISNDNGAPGNVLLMIPAPGVGAKVQARYGETLPTIPSASGIDYLYPAAGATDRSVGEKLGEFVSVKDFGAVGDGVTDDTAAFEAALSAAYKVFVPATSASYRVDNVRVQSGRMLCGEGVLSKLTPFTVGAAYMLEPDSAASDITIRGLWLDAPKATYPAKVPIVAGTATRVVVESCRITGGATPVFMTAATDCVVRDCYISDFATSGVVFETSSLRCKVLGCNFVGTGSTAHDIQFTNATGFVAESNSILGAGVFGIFGDNSVSCVVSNNTTRETVREGINLNRCNNCTISDNGVSFLSVGSVGTDFGISLWGSGGVSRNNVISGNTVVNSFLSGIALAGDEDIQAYNVVIGNTIENCGRSNGADTAGVVIYGTDSINNLVADNVVFDNVGVLRYGVFDDPVVGAPTGTKIRGNLVQGASVADVSRSSTSIEALNGRALQSWSPTVTPVSGTITTLGAVTGHYYEVEKMVFISVSITITTNGTGAGALLFTLPFTAGARNAVLMGREGAVTGAALSCVIAAAGTQAALRTYDNVYPGGDGRTIIASGWYERA